MHGVVGGLNNHVMEPEPGQRELHRPGRGGAISGDRGLRVPADGRIEVLDDPDLPGGAAAGGEAEDFGRALALAADAEGTRRRGIRIGVRVRVRVGGGGVGFEVGGAASPGRRDDDPTVENGISPDLRGSRRRRRRR